jgi:hypothetical protein
MTTFSFTIFLNFDISKMCQSVTRNVFCILFFIISYCNFCPLCFIQDSKLCLLEILSNANYSCVVWILIIVISYLSFDSVPHYIYMEKIFYLSFYLSSCMSCLLYVLNRKEKDVEWATSDTNFIFIIRYQSQLVINYLMFCSSNFTLFLDDLIEIVFMRIIQMFNPCIFDWTTIILAIRIIANDETIIFKKKRNYIRMRYKRKITRNWIGIFLYILCFLNFQIRLFESIRLARN